MMTGGWSGPKAADQVSSQAFSAVKEQVESHALSAVGALSVDTYQTQVVAGLNILLHLSDENQPKQKFKAQVFRSLQGSYQLVDFSRE